jgi:hypothetical protein
MITEIRMIGFSTDALAEAVSLFGQAKQDRYFTEVRDIRVRPGNPPTVIAEVCGDGSDATDTIEFTAAETAAFLILLCRRRQIPLPHRADKTLRMVGSELCLVITRRAFPEQLAQAPVDERELDGPFENPDGA